MRPKLRAANAVTLSPRTIEALREAMARTDFPTSPVTSPPEPKEPEFVYELEAWRDGSTYRRRVTVIAKDFLSAREKAKGVLSDAGYRGWDFTILTITERM